MTAGRDRALVLAREVGRAARRPGAARTLFLDLDGTLAPIAPTPGAARVPRETLEALRRLAGQGWKVTIVSGRPAAAARRLVPLRRVKVVGCHGIESGTGDALPREIRRRVRRLASAARALPRGFRGALVEVKPAGIAFHDRNVARENLVAWRRVVRRLLAVSDLRGLEVLRGRRVIEVRPEGCHKGRVLERFPRRPSRNGRPDLSLVAFGDDRTDEDLFAGLRPAGLAVRVGRGRPRTLANRALPSPAAVRRFLKRLADMEEEHR